MPEHNHAPPRYGAAWPHRTLPILLVVAAAAGCDEAGDRSLGLLLTENAVPDYVVTELDTSYVAPLTDLSTLAFHVTVKNIGDSDDRATAVSMYVDGEYVQEMKVLGLASQADTTVVMSWPAETGTHEVIFGVDHPAADTSFIPESNEGNNLDTISVFVLHGPRQVADEDTLTFSALPSATLNDSLVQQVLDIAADSGYSVGASTPMIRTQYDEGDVTAYYIPLGGFSAPADSGAVLTIVTDTVDGGATIPYITQVIDTTTFVAYNSQGGARFQRSGGIRQVSMLNGQPATCVEGSTWGCVVRKGVPPILACSDSVHTRIRPLTPISQLASTLRGGGCGVGVPGFPSNKKKLKDNPPRVYLSGFIGDICQECDGPDLMVYWRLGYVFTAIDDRGPVTYLTHRIWVSSCFGGSTTFQARDNAGQTVTVNLTVNLPPNPVLVYRDHEYCHNQGGGS
jgi:hypothetical protein